MNFKNISLTGFMGSGKSTIGKILAKKLGFTFIDLDRVIELAEGKEIKDIFKFKGERYFRDLEIKVTGKQKERIGFTAKRSKTPEKSMETFGNIQRIPSEAVGLFRHSN